MIRAEVAVLAKAPVPGLAKTRLIPALGPEGAAALQARFIRRAVTTALAADLGPVTLWCAPDTDHPVFAALGGTVSLHRQPDGDLGRRMALPFAEAGGPLVLIGTDCPCLQPADLVSAARALQEGADVALSPAEDGGYGLIAARALHPTLFEGIPWSTADVFARTLRRAEAAGLVVHAGRTVWDVDVPADLDRLARLTPPLGA